MYFIVLGVESASTNKFGRPGTGALSNWSPPWVVGGGWGVGITFSHLKGCQTRHRSRQVMKDELRHIVIKAGRLGGGGVLCLNSSMS